MATSSTVRLPEPPKANLCGLFAGDWSTEEKIGLLAETFTIFSSLQKIAEEQRLQRRQQERHEHVASTSLQSFLPPVQTLQYFHRVSNLYREALRRYINALEASEKEEDTPDMEIAQTIHTVMHFAEIIYIPADGRGNGVFGEEILHWLNSFDFAPRTEDGQAIAQSAVPYEHHAFWDYILRCVLRGFHNSASSLLASLASGHPTSTLRQIAKRVCELLATMPRSTSYSLEHDFLGAHRRWVTSVRSVLNKIEQDMDEMEAELERESDGQKSREEIEDERLEYEAQFRCLLELMVGVKERVFEACEDWREALGAWGILVQPSLKRDDVPQIIETIVTSLPIDATLSSDAILYALAQGNVRRACVHARRMDPWLSVHLTDLLDKVDVLETDGANEEGEERMTGLQDNSSLKEEPLRVRYIKEYAETVLDDQGLWRLAVDYLSYCGSSARRRMRFIILDVPLLSSKAVDSNKKFTAKRAEEVEADALDAEMNEQADDPDEAAEVRRSEKVNELEAKRVSDEYDTAMDVIQTCVELGMLEEARAVCKQMSTEMMKQNRMGPALAYCVRAQDSRQLKRIVDAILRLYIDVGVEEFTEAVDSIPFSLLKRETSYDAHPDEIRTNENKDDVVRDDPLTKIVGNKGAMASTGRLLFLAGYRDFHRLYGEGSLRSAATLLVEMLASNSVPESFQAVLLVDAIPLLQSAQRVLTSEESYELLRVLDNVAMLSSSHPRQAQYYLGMLESLLNPSKVDNRGGDESDDAWESDEHHFDANSAVRRLDILRLALVRHLAGSVVHG